ncbi:MAG TPA: divergent polysaccharide deacetylase family protein [Candidatus Eisenbacteria bacterium]
MILILALVGLVGFLVMPAGRRLLFGARVMTATADPQVPATELARLFGESLKAALAPVGVDTTLVRVESLAAGEKGSLHQRWEVPLPRGLSADSASTLLAAAAVPFHGKPQPAPEGGNSGFATRLRADVQVEAVFLVPDARTDGRPRLALLVHDFVQGKESREIIDFAREITVAIPPGTTGARDLADGCRRVGIEVLVDLPMEDLNYPTNDPGPKGILVDLTEREIMKRVGEAYKLLGGAEGVHTLGGNLAVEDRSVMTAIIGEVKKRRGYFLDSTRSTFSTVEEVAAAAGVPSRKVRSPGALDYPTATAAQVEAKLAELAETARSRGVAVGILRPYPGTVEALRKMLPAWAASGLEVVPVSEVVAIPGKGANPSR